MKTWKNNMGPIVVALAQLIVGIIFLTRPEGLTSLVIVLIGVFLAIGGIGAVIRYFRTNAEKAATGQELTKGLCMLAAGVFCVFRASWFVESFQVLAMLYGAVILATGLGKVQWTVDMLRLKKSKWYLAAFGAAVTIVFGAVVVLNPFKTVEVLWVFLGVALIVEAAVDGVTLFFRLKGEPVEKETAEEEPAEE